MTFSDYDGLSKLFSLSLFDEENYPKYRVCKKEPYQSTGKPAKCYKGCAAVIVLKNTLFEFKYNTNDSRVQIVFYSQRYTENVFSLKASVQTQTDLHSSMGKNEYSIKIL